MSATCTGRSPPRDRSHRLRWPLFVLVWLWLAAPWATAQAPDAHADGVAVIGLDSVSATLSGLFDPDQSLDFASASSPALAHRFQPLGRALNAGYSGGAWWLRVDLSVPPAMVGRTAYLQAWMPDLDEVRFRTPDGVEHANGVIVPVAQRGAQVRVPTVELKLAAPTTTVHLRVKASGTATLIPQVLSPLALLEASERQMFYLGALGGALLIVLVINLVNAYATRESIFFVYAGLVATAGLTTLSRYGFLNADLIPDARLLIPLIALPVNLLAVFAILFSSRILRIDQTHPRLFKPLQGLAILIGLSFSLQFTDWALYANQMLMVVMLAYGLVSMLVSGWDTLRAPKRSGIFVFAAYAAFMSAQIISIFAALGTVPATLMTVQAWEYGTWIHLLLLHLALASGLRVERHRARTNELAMRVAQAELEEQRRASEDKSRFIEMLAHEINTPLSVIDSSVQSLEMLTDIGSDAVRERHRRIRSSVHLVSRLINETASRDRLDNGAWQVRLSQIDPRALIASVIDPLEHRLTLIEGGEPFVWPCEVGGSPGAVEVRIGTPLAPILADHRLVEIAMSNLVDNARKYATPGTTIRVEARRLTRPEAGREGSSLLLTVTSAGGTTAQAELDQLFNKYFRAHTHPGVAGIGLGLYLVRSIAELHGGQAGVEAVDGPGLRFWIRLPVDETR